MSRIVIKYGGSNLCEPQGISKLIRIIRNYNDPVLVVSALFGVTDSIDHFLNDTPLTPANIRVFTKELFNKHKDFLWRIISVTPKRKKISDALSKRILELEHLLLGIYCLEETPVHMKSHILSYGERLSSLLISGILQAEGLVCSEALPESIGFMAKGDAENASVDLGASSSAVKSALAIPGIVVIPGFYGITSEGRVSLLGRGGTDYSAACIAHCLNASSLDIWKDVNGFLSSDPAHISGVVSLESLTYDEAAELAYFGARILHPRTVEPLVEKKIPIRLFSTSTDSLDPVSLIDDRSRVTTEVIKSITYSDQYAVLKLSGAGVGIKPGVLAKTAAILNDNGINISSVITSQIAINLIIERSNAMRATELIRSLELPVLKEIKLLDGVTLLALVGHGMIEQHGVAARTFTVLAREGINVYLSSMGASDVTTYLVIDRKDKQKAMEGIHREFFSPLQTGTLKIAG